MPTPQHTPTPPSNSSPLKARRPLVAHRGRFLLLIAALPVALGLVTTRVYEWPALLVLLYAILTLAFGTRAVRLDANGLRTRTTPPFAGVRAWRAQLGDITSVRRHHHWVIKQRSARPVDVYTVVADLRSGQEVPLLGPFARPEDADAALPDVRAVWPNVPIGEPQSGLTRTIRMATVRATLFWVLWFVVGLLLSALGTTYMRG